MKDSNTKNNNTEQKTTGSKNIANDAKALANSKPTPQNLNVQEQVNPRLANAVINDEPPNSSSDLEEIKEIKKKSSFPKFLRFFAVFFILAGLSVFLFLKFGKDGTTTPSGTKGEIVWWGTQHEASVYQPLIDEFEKDNPHLKIVYERQSTKDYKARLVSALASGSGPDIFEIHNSWPVMLKSQLSALPASVMSQDEYKASFYPIIVSNMTLDKGIVGMPLEYDALTLYINEDVFTSALKTPPETWDQLRDLSTELTSASDKRIIQAGVAMGITENVDHWPEIVGLMLIQNGVNPAKPIGKKATDVFTTYKTYSRAKVWDNTLPESTAAFERGELAMYFGPGRRASEIIKANPYLKFRTTKLPQLPKDKPDDPSYSYATYWSQGVSETSDVKEAAWTFLKYLSREDSLRKINDNIAATETVKRVFPRPGMNSEMVQDPILGSIVFYAYDARSFFLADQTYDDENGINTSVNNLYETIVKKWAAGKTKELDAQAQELALILGKFGVSVK